VFFLSRYMHEVLPVSCPSKAFADSRFTINGWVRRTD
ncbi:MAG: proline hydroxylase, partial [Microcoleus sp.]